MRSLITIVLVAVLVLGCIWWWRNSHSGTLYDGSVVRRDAAMESGATTVDNGANDGEQAHPTPSRSDAPGTINTDPASSYDTDTRDPNAPGEPDAQQPSKRSQKPSPSSPSSSTAPQISYNDTNASSAEPAADSQSPNAPDGVRFGGTGVYQLYRQGNLTFRVDTRNGSSCILYATMEEWRKPTVSRNGCRAS